MCLLLAGQIPLLLPKSHCVVPYGTVLYGLANCGMLILAYFPSICSKRAILSVNVTCYKLKVKLRCHSFPTKEALSTDGKNAVAVLFPVIKQGCPHPSSQWRRIRLACWPRRPWGSDKASEGAPRPSGTEPPFSAHSFSCGYGNPSVTPTVYKALFFFLLLLHGCFFLDFSILSTWFLFHKKKKANSMQHLSPDAGHAPCIKHKPPCLQLQTVLHMLQVPNM